MCGNPIRLQPSVVLLQMSLSQDNATWRHPTMDSYLELKGGFQRRVDREGGWGVRVGNRVSGGRRQVVSGSVGVVGVLYR